MLNISDVRDPHAVSYLVQGQDFLFNLAGQTSHLDSMIDPRTDLEINASAQLSILEACRKHNPNVKIVFAGTRQVYGKPQYLPVDEKHPINPVDVNGINKLAGEWYHLLYNNVYGIKACALRDRGFLSGLTGVWALPMPGSRWSVDEAGPNGASPGRERGDEAQSGGGAGRTTP